MQGRQTRTWRLQNGRPPRKALLFDFYMHFHSTIWAEMSLVYLKIHFKGNNKILVQEKLRCFPFSQHQWNAPQHVSESHSGQEIDSDGSFPRWWRRGHWGWQRAEASRAQGQGETGLVAVGANIPKLCVAQTTANCGLGAVLNSLSRDLQLPKLLAAWSLLLEDCGNHRLRRAAQMETIGVTVSPKCLQIIHVTGWKKATRSARSCFCLWHVFSLPSHEPTVLVIC